MDAASDHPVPVVCATKRKASAPAQEDEEQSKHLHHGHVLAARPKGGAGGGVIWIDEDEGTRIMMGTRTALKKNLTRRVSSTATEDVEVQPKRTRRAAATSDDGELLSRSFFCPLFLLRLVLCS